MIKVQTHANISLNKYWGKRDEKLFLPTKSSLTISLSALKTTTFIHILENFYQDNIWINGNFAQGLDRQKIVDFLNFFRQKYRTKRYFEIFTSNNFPTGAGLASSSSGFAALALGLDKICNLKLSQRELSVLARQGSGSACRSIFGGFVIWHRGTMPDGTDSYAEQLFDHTHWPELCILVVVVRDQAKFIGSREGMRMTVATSASYNNWLEKSAYRLPILISAISKKDFTTVGQLAQDDWQDMQRTMLDTVPQLNYWAKESCMVMDKVKNLYNHGTECYFTTEAGPNLKVLCLENNQNKIINELKKVPGVIEIITCKVASNPVVEDLRLKQISKGNYEVYNI